MAKRLIQCIHLSKSFFSQTIIDQLNLSIHEREIFALIGENGCGKSTFLRLLSGELDADGGHVKTMPHLRIAYLRQEEGIYAEKQVSVREYLTRNVFSRLESAMSKCLEDPSRLNEWEQLHDEYESKGGYQQIPLEKAMRELKLSEALLEKKMCALSVGMRTRIALAKVFLEQSDLLLLDEPSNHLDKQTTQWLAEYLSERKGASILVTHDRKLMNQTCNRILELKEGKITAYFGNYEIYLKEVKNKQEEQLKLYKHQQEKRKELKERIKALTFAKKAASPPKDSNVMAYDYRGGNHQKSQKHVLDSLKSQLEEIETNLIAHPKPKTIKGMDFDPPDNPPKILLQMHAAKKQYGEKVLFSNWSKTLERGEKVVLRGKNGAGKTTLLRCILQEIPLDSGGLQLPASLQVGYLDQEARLIPLNETPLQYFQKKYQLNEERLRKELHKAALGGEGLIRKPFSKLSVGQRKRMALLELTLQKPELILLDEPTNHLDVLTIEALETALQNYKGGLIAISHDETFTNKIATKVWTL